MLSSLCNLSLTVPLFILVAASISACKKVFPDKSFLDYGTFVLRSPEHYRNIENKKKRDKAEGAIEHKNEQGQQSAGDPFCLLDEPIIGFVYLSDP